MPGLCFGLHGTAVWIGTVVDLFVYFYPIPVARIRRAALAAVHLYGPYPGPAAGLAIIGVEFQRRFIMLNGLFHLSLPETGIAQVVLRFLPQGSIFAC